MSAKPRYLMCAWLLVAALLVAAASPAHAQQAVHGEATLTASGGFARLVLKLDDDVDSSVATAGSILIIRFKRPVDLAVDALADAAPDYVGAVRIDPDRLAIRMALARKVTVNTMNAGERLFVDLLPEGWKGAPPPLPQEVVRELAERARAAEAALRAQRARLAAKKPEIVPVRASVQPTFVRFVFETPAGVGVSSALMDNRLILGFNRPLTFDLADAKLAQPPNIGAITQKSDSTAASVEFALIGNVDVHAFRDDKNFIVDVGLQQASPTVTMAAPERPAVASPAGVPAAKPESKPVAKPEAKAADPSAGIVPPTSETIAREAKQTPAPEKSEPKENSKEKAEQKPPASPVTAEMPKVPPAPANNAVGTKAAGVAPTPVSPPAMVTSADSANAVEVRRNGEGFRLVFPLAQNVPAALFRRADAVWIVFDSKQAVDLGTIRRDAGALVGDVNRIELPQGQAIRLRLIRPQLVALGGDDSPDHPGRDGKRWMVTFADTMPGVTQPLVAVRNVADPTHASVSVTLQNPGRLHRFVDPDAGDTLMVVTAQAPARGFIRRQNFVEFALLESVHGVVIQPNADDVTATVLTDKVSISRPGGLTLSAADFAAGHATTAARPLFDAAAWHTDLTSPFLPRLDALIRAAAAATGDDRSQAHIDLARFYMARGMYPEACGALEIALADASPGKSNPTALILHSIASSLSGRPARALKDLADPAIGSNYDSQLWRALALAQQEKWSEIGSMFKASDVAIAALPLELQRPVLLDAMRAAIEVGDYTTAASRSGDLDVVGLTDEFKPAAFVLRGRLADVLGYRKDALRDYRLAINSSDPRAATEARLFDIALRQKRNEISDEDALRELETTSVMWRGDSIEIRTLQMLSRLYRRLGRFGDALAAEKTATKLQPNSEMSREMQDEAADLFSDLFLGSKGKDLPPVDALALFYEYRELTPIGRRGDEMIRRLADRLVAVDLLDQAAELLQYQVDHRLEGAARAQVAARLAMVYLMNRKPDHAIDVLHSTRIADLASELRQQRLLLEARAQSDIGRRDLALDIIANLDGKPAIRLRSDILWGARRWRAASEQIELYYGDRWRDFTPLNAVEKSDVIRAVIGYALADDKLGLARFREKYAPLMAGAADRAAFDTASKPVAANSAEFVQIARMAARVDTLDGFLREMKGRFPDTAAKLPESSETAKDDPATTGSLPAIVGLKQQVRASR